MMRRESTPGATEACGWLVKSASALLLLSLPLLLGEQKTADAFPTRAPVELDASMSFEPGVTVQAWRLPPNAESRSFVDLAFDDLPAESFGFGGRAARFGASTEADRSEVYEVFHEVSLLRQHGMDLSLAGIRPSGISQLQLDDMFKTMRMGQGTPAELDFFSQTTPSEWGYLLPILRPEVDEKSPPNALRLRFPPIYTNGLAATLGNLLIGGIDYIDPLAVGVPLLQVVGYEDLNISPHFRVRDFSTHDGAALARISPSLVMGLESLFEKAGPIQIISGYRHRSYNKSVRGATESRHMAGQAADIWSPTKSSLYLARRVVDAMGCGIGVGLGRNTLHVDVRGTLATWTYPGAPLSERAFDLWIRMLCSGRSDYSPNLAAQIDWMIGDSLQVDDFPLFEEFDPNMWIQSMHAPLAEYASAAWFREGPGVVVINMTRGVPSLDRGIGDFVRYVRIRTEEVADLGLQSMIEIVAGHDPLRYFVYAVYLADGSVLTGLASLDASLDPSGSGRAGSYPTPSNPETESARLPTSQRAPRNQTRPRTEPAVAEPGQSGWAIVVASTVDPLEAESHVERYGGLLARFNLEVRYNVDASGNVPRYRITAGQFRTASDAQDGLRRIRGIVPGDSWLLPVNQ